MKKNVLLVLSVAFSLILIGNLQKEIVFDYTANSLAMGNESVVINEDVICDYDETEKSLSCYVENTTDCLYCSSSYQYTLDDFGFTDAEILEFVSIDFDSFDTSIYENVKKIAVSSSNISGDVDLSNSSKLESLTFDLVDVESIDLSNNLELNYLYLTGNSSGITSLDLTNNINLETLSLANIYFSELDLTNNLMLKSLYITESFNLDVLDITKNINLESLTLNNMSLEEIDITDNVNLKELSLCRVAIKDWDLSNNVLLESLDVSFSYFDTGLDLTNNTLLNKVSIFDSLLESIDLSNNSELTYLSLDWNDLTSLDLSNNINLSYLSLEDNNLSSLDLTNNTLLTDDNVYIDGNDIEEITRLDTLLEEEAEVVASSSINLIIIILSSIIVVLVVLILVLILKKNKSLKKL